MGQRRTRNLETRRDLGLTNPKSGVYFSESLGKVSQETDYERPNVSCWWLCQGQNPGY